MATLHDVARKSGVSVATVSNVFTRKKYVSPETHRKVKEVCHELNYKPNPIAASMITKKTGIIGLFLDTQKDVFHTMYPDLIKGVGLEAAHIGYSPLLFFNVSGKEDFSRLFVNKTHYIDGAIIISPQRDDFRINELLKDNIPFVVFGNPPENLNVKVPYIDSPNEDDSYTLTTHLLSNGHSDILFLNNSEKITLGRDRAKGFKRAHEDNGIKINPELVFEISGYHDVSEILRAVDGKFTACVVESNDSAREVYKYAVAKGLEIGKNLAVVSLGGMKETFLPELTSVYVDFEEAGISAVKLLKEAWDKNIQPHYIMGKSHIKISTSSDFTYGE